MDWIFIVNITRSFLSCSILSRSAYFRAAWCPRISFVYGCFYFSCLFAWSMFIPCNCPKSPVCLKGLVCLQWGGRMWLQHNIFFMHNNDGDWTKSKVGVKLLCVVSRNHFNFPAYFLSCERKIQAKKAYLLFINLLFIIIYLFINLFINRCSIKVNYVINTGHM